MGNTSNKITHSQKIIGFFAVITILSICGCGEFFDEKATEIQSKSILSDLSAIKTVPDSNISVPYIYEQPPEVLETKDGVKLFYFTKYHTVDKLSLLIKEQLGYKVSQNPATNQLIIRCPNNQESQIALQFLKQVDVPPIQVRIDCLVSELYADVTMDWETTLKIENLFGEKIFLGGKTVEGILKPAFPGASLREKARELIGLKVGYSENLGLLGHEFRALVDLLISRGYLKILMNPTLEVVNGQTAKIEARDFVPLPKEIEVVTAGQVFPYMTTEYQWVVDSLEITPHVFADGYIGLETIAQIGSKSTPEGVKQVPIITERKIQNKENRIRRGESLIIGGIRKSEERSVVRGVPFLKDIPLLGVLFSSKDYEDRAKEVIFIITPTISTGGVPTKDMLETIRKKHESPLVTEALQELQKTIMDPFGLETRQAEYELKTRQMEKARLEAEREKEKARISIREAYERAKRERAAGEKATTEAEKIMAEAEKIKAEAEMAKAQAEMAKAQAEMAKAEAEKAKAQAQKAAAQQEKTTKKPGPK